jgi:hypothetical protein
MEAKLMLSSLSGGYGILLLLEHSKVMTLPVNAYLSNPQFISLVPPHSRHARRGIALQALVPHVARVANVTQIFEAIIGPVAVDVINLTIRPITAMHCPSDPVRLVMPVPNLPVEIPLHT